jgi:hypothetical protein
LTISCYYLILPALFPNGKYIYFKVRFNFTEADTAMFVRNLFMTVDGFLQGFLQCLPAAGKTGLKHRQRRGILSHIKSGERQ